MALSQQPVGRVTATPATGGLELRRALHLGPGNWERDLDREGAAQTGAPCFLVVRESAW